MLAAALMMLSRCREDLARCYEVGDVFAIRTARINLRRAEVLAEQIAFQVGV